jgi:CheY-like chemotaxis protein
LRGAALRAREVVRRILAFSRHESAAPEVLDAGALVKEVTALLRVALPANHAITLSGSAANTILGNPAQLHQVMMNLGTNASQAIGARSGHIQFLLRRVTIAEETSELRSGEYVEIAVTDDGDGMDAATQARIFEPFFTTKAREQGTGLGLSVVHGIVAEHAGAIRVESEPGRGTTMRVLLPATLLEPSPGALQAPGPARSTADLVKGDALVVDDEAMIGRLLVRIFERHGVSAQTLSSPDKALAMVRAEPERFGVIVTDMAMPSMTGTELAVALRAVGYRGVLVLSSGTDFVIAGTPFDDVLPKPYIVNTVTELLQRHRLQGS